MNREEKSLFAFLKEYKDEPNVPDYTGEYPPPYELTQDDAELILNVKEKQDKEIERLNNIIKEVRKYIDKEHKLLYLDKKGYTYTKLGKDILGIIDKGE